MKYRNSLICNTVNAEKNDVVLLRFSVVTRIIFLLVIRPRSAVIRSGFHPNILIPELSNKVLILIEPSTF
jgi:hypothetical protein